MQDLSKEEVKKLGKDFVSCMSAEEVWHPKVWANNNGKIGKFINALNIVFPATFGLYFQIGMEILGHKLMQRGMKGGCDKWMLRTLSLMHDQEMLEFEKNMEIFKANIGKADNGDIAHKVDELTDLLRIEYDKSKDSSGS